MVASLSILQGCAVTFLGLTARAIADCWNEEAVMIYAMKVKSVGGWNAAALADL